MGFARVRSRTGMIARRPHLTRPLHPKGLPESHICGTNFVNYRNMLRRAARFLVVMAAPGAAMTLKSPRKFISRLCDNRSTRGGEDG
jgi:hypothetical protein